MKRVTFLRGLSAAVPLAAVAPAATLAAVARHAAAKRPAKPRLVTMSDGLKYIDTTVGTGPMPKAGQTVFVHYVGTLENGAKFDSSRDRGTPFSFPLGEGQVIKGWDEGVATMRVGGRRKLIIPPALGYGAAGAGGVIPPNAVLHFDIELLHLG